VVVAIIAVSVFCARFLLLTALLHVKAKAPQLGVLQTGVRAVTWFRGELKKGRDTLFGALVAGPSLMGFLPHIPRLRPSAVLNQL